MNRTTPYRCLLPTATGFLLLCGACGASPATARRRATAQQQQGPTLRVEASGDGAQHYDTRPEGDGLVAIDGAEAWAPRPAHLAEALGEVLEPAGALQGDDRLAHLARLTLPHVPEGQRLAPRPAVTFLARHLGLTDEPLAVGVSALPPSGDPVPALGDLASALARRVPNASHFGLLATERFGLRILVLALGRRPVRLRPIPRRLEPKATLRLRGTVDPRYTSLRLRAESIGEPDRGSGEEPTWIEGSMRPRGDAGVVRFDGRLRLERRGVYRILLSAEGPDGAETLLALPLYVGQDPPRVLQIPLTPARPFDPEAARSAIAGGIARLRAERDLPPLRDDALLDRVADAHARELVERGALEHRSASGASPEKRLRAVGYPHRLLLENLGRAADPDALLRAWMHSETHRRNLLHADARRLGLAVRPVPASEGGGLIAVAMLVQPAERIDTATAPEALLAAINRLRRTRRARPLRQDPKLQEAADAAARRYFEEPETSERALVEEASASLRSLSIAYGRVGGVLVTVTRLEEAARLEPVLDASVRYVGLGVAQGSRPGGPPDQIVVVVLLGWPR